MTARAMNNRRYEEQESGSNVPAKILAAVGLFGLAILLIYICLASPQAGTSMGAIKDVLVGLGGNIAVVIPLVLVWAGVLCIGAARGMKINLVRVAADALLILCLFTAVHMFFIRTIIDHRQIKSEYFNIVIWSYREGIGGGLLGALLAYPFHQMLGVAGGFLVTLLMAVLLLTATGRMGRFVRFVGSRAEARRESHKNEHEFDDFESRKPARAASRSRVNRDPFSESLVSGADVPADKPRRRTAQAAQPAASGRRASARIEEVSARPAQPARAARRNADAMSDEFGGRPARAANQPRKRPATGVAAAEPVQQKKRKKLYNEDMEKVAPTAAAKDPLFDEFDDFDRLEAESAALDKIERAERPRKKAFEIDRPSSMKAEKAEKAGIVDIPDAEPEKPVIVKADRKSNVSIDDLKIEPEAYEVPDDDEPPFDMPAEKARKKEVVRAGIAEKPSFSKIKRVKEAEPAEDDPAPYNYPPLDLLAQGEVEDTSVHNNRDMQKAQLLEDTLQSFGISAKLTGIAHGPAVTRFELQPAPGVKVSRITSLADDIALNLAAMSVRIEAPIPGKAAVGVEIPNDKVEMVRLRDVLESSDARKHPSRIAVGLGKDNSGRYIVADIAKMPHVLIAGQTGSGKSVCINAIITSILFRSSPEEVKLILIDPKVVELSVYNNIPHLVCPVVTDPKKAASALDWAVAEMTKRYKLFAERGVRDIKGYNKSLKEGEKLMPQMVIIIDELADLMMVSPGEVEDSICRLAQLARACGMHLVIATQRPSVNVITGIIKANIPTRIAFSVASQVDSRTMIDHGGAEKLLGNGDMLFVPNGMKSMRVQGAWVSDDEVHAIVEYIKQSGEAVYDPDMIEHLENATRTDAEKEEIDSEYDPKLAEAVDIAIDLGQVSISMLQRKMRIGYARAGRIIDEMSRRGIVSEADGSKPRNILITREQANEMFEDCA